MALTSSSRPTDPHNPTLQQLLDEHLNWLKIKGYSDYTVRTRFVHIRFFLHWCAERGFADPKQITENDLQQYQQHTFDYRKRSGEPLALASRHARLVPLRVWLRWMVRLDIVPDGLVNAIELRRLG
jgi:integrase/recombinase XerD